MLFEECVRLPKRYRFPEVSPVPPGPLGAQRVVVTTSGARSQSPPLPASASLELQRKEVRVQAWTSRIPQIPEFSAERFRNPCTQVDIRILHRIAHALPGLRVTRVLLRC